MVIARSLIALSLSILAACATTTYQPETTESTTAEETSGGEGTPVHPVALADWQLIAEPTPQSSGFTESTYTNGEFRVGFAAFEDMTLDDAASGVADGLEQGRSGCERHLDASTTADHVILILNCGAEFNVIRSVYVLGTSNAGVLVVGSAPTGDNEWDLMAVVIKVSDELRDFSN